MAAFPGNRRLDTDIRCRQIQLDIIRQAYDLGYLDTLFRLQFIPGNTGALTDIGDRYLYAESIQRLL